MVNKVKIKQCSKCGESKPISEFLKAPHHSDGLSSQCRVCKNKQAIKHIQKVKLEVLSHYNNGLPLCSECGFGDINALSIDHINGRGTQHKKSLGIPGGIAFYCWLKKQGFPEGYQTLCMNCQWIKKVKNRECYTDSQEAR